MTEMVKCRTCGFDMEENRIGEHWSLETCIMLLKNQLSTVTAERDTWAQKCQIEHTERVTLEERVIGLKNQVTMWRESKGSDTEAPHD